MSKTKFEYEPMKIMCICVFQNQREFIDTYSWKHGMTLSAVIRKALNEFMDKELKR